MIQSGPVGRLISGLPFAIISGPHRVAVAEGRRTNVKGKDGRQYTNNRTRLHPSPRLSWAMIFVCWVGAPEMLHSAFVALIVIVCPLLWIMIVVPAIAKCFRAPYKFAALPFDRRNESLSRWQSFWFAGVLGWGVSVFLVGFLIHYFGEFSKEVTNLHLVFLLVFSCLSGGALSLWIPRKG